jgi:uncharacterized coiled-coil protein SlyX
VATVPALDNQPAVGDDVATQTVDEGGPSEVTLGPAKGDDAGEEDFLDRLAEMIQEQGLDTGPDATTTGQQRGEEVSPLDRETGDDDLEKRRKSLNADYTRKTQALADERRQLAAMQAQTMALLQQAQASQNGPLPGQAQQQTQPPPATQHFRAEDFYTEAGELNVETLTRFTAAQVQAQIAEAVRAGVAPLEKKMTQAEEAEAMSELEGRFQQLEKRNAHFRDHPDVQARVVEYMQKQKIADPELVWMKLYPAQYALSLVEALKAKRGTAQNQAGGAPPSTPPGSRARGKPVITTEKDRVDAMAGLIARNGIR